MARCPQTIANGIQMRWLVTGGVGFTGKHAVSILRERGDEVVSLGRSAAADMCCDIGDAVALGAAVRAARPERVIHLAAAASVVHGDRDSFHRINVTGTENLLRACAGLPSPPKVALASSSNVYGIHAGIVTEEAQAMPVSDYGRSKLAMEVVAEDWVREVPILIARPFNYTGPGQSEKFVIAKIAAHFCRRDPFIELGDINVLRDFSDVRDIVEDYILLLDRWSGSGDTVNLCSGRASSLAFIINTFTELTHHRPEIRRNPTLIRDREIPVLVGDPTKLGRITGRTHRFPLESTLREMLNPR